MDELPQPTSAGELVYVGMAADLLHPGHISLLNTAATYGEVVVGILTDDAITSYKRTPLLPFEARVQVIESLRMVSRVMPQETLDYVPNLRSLRPRYVVHGDDWKTGVQAHTRQAVIACLEEWNGILIEPGYTAGYSSSDLHAALFRHLFPLAEGKSARKPFQLANSLLQTCSQVVPPVQPGHPGAADAWMLRYPDDAFLWTDPYILYAHLLAAVHDGDNPVLLVLPQTVPLLDIATLAARLSEIQCAGVVLEVNDEVVSPERALQTVTACAANSLCCILVGSESSICRFLTSTRDLPESRTASRLGVCCIDNDEPKLPGGSFLVGVIVEGDAQRPAGADFSVCLTPPVGAEKQRIC